MKTRYLIVSPWFPKHHPLAGSPTHFVEAIKNGDKIHTIRSNYAEWKKIASQVNSGEAVLSLRYWDGSPYQSKQVEFMQLSEIAVEPISIQRGEACIGPNLVSLEHVAENDGLKPQEFKDWFGDQLIGGGIIHFTNFRYIQ